MSSASITRQRSRGGASGRMPGRRPLACRMSEAEEMTTKALLRCPKTTAAALATLLKVTPRQAQRVIASLKVKAGLKRRGGRKNGEWYFEKEEER